MDSRVAAGVIIRDPRFTHSLKQTMDIITLVNRGYRSMEPTPIGKPASLARVTRLRLRPET